jgi:two-component system response regulator RegA
MAVVVESVLVVDDERSLLAIAQRTLKASYKVLTAPDTEQARRIALDARPSVVILDLRVGRSSGLELLRSLKRELPDTIFVLYSGYMSLAIGLAAARAGAEHVLQKPITYKEILRRVVNEVQDEDPEDTPTLARVEWDHIARVLDDCNGNVSEAARRLGIFRSSLQRRLRKHAPPK